LSSPGLSGEDLHLTISNESLRLVCRRVGPLPRARERTREGPKRSARLARKEPVRRRRHLVALDVSTLRLPALDVGLADEALVDVRHDAAG
jgi:hypothetical protein